MRPGIRRRCSSRAAKKPNDGPAEVQAVAERLALADADVDADSPGGREDPERDRVACAIATARTAARPALGGELSALERPRRRRGSSAAAKNAAQIVVVDRLRPRSRSVTPSRSGDLDDLVPKPARSVRSVSRACGCRPARDHEAAAAVVQLGQVRGGGRPPRAPRRPRRWRRAGRSARRSRSGTRTSPAARPARSPAGRACRGSGTPSAPSACRSAPARSGRTSRAEEADLVLGADVARRQLAQVRVDRPARLPVGQLERAVAAARAGGDLRSNSSSTEPTPIAASIAVRSASVTAV